MAAFLAVTLHLLLFQSLSAISDAAGQLQNETMPDDTVAVKDEVSVEYIRSNSGFSVEFVEELSKTASGLQSATVLDNTVYVGLVSDGSVSSQSEVWSYNGEETRFLCQVASGNLSATNYQPVNYPREFVIYKDRVYFAGDGSSSGLEFWACFPTGEESTGTIIFKGGENNNIQSLTAFDGLLYFAGYENESAWSEGNPSLMVSDGTPEGTMVFLPNERVFSILGVVPGMKKMVFSVADTVWTTDGSLEGTKPFLSALSLEQISEPFNGGKYALAARNQLLISNFENETYVLIEDFSLRDWIKFNETHLIFSGRENTTLWITDGTINGTCGIFSLDGGEFFISHFVAENQLAVSHVNIEARASRIFLTDGTKEGTFNLQGWPEVQSKGLVILPDGRSLVVLQANDTDDVYLGLYDFPRGEFSFIEDVSMPATLDSGLYRRMFPINNDTVVFFEESQGSLNLWELNYPPRRMDTTTSPSEVPTDTTAPPSEAPTESSANAYTPSSKWLVCVLCSFTLAVACVLS